MGLGGQAHLIIPSVQICLKIDKQVTPCFQCLYALFPDPSTELYPLCTIVSHPVLPEHCITYAKQILWEKKRPNEPFDTENEEHIQWIYHEALERSLEFGIEGVTVQLTRVVDMERFNWLESGEECDNHTSRDKLSYCSVYA